MRGHVKRVGDSKYRVVYDLPRSVSGKRRQKTETIFGNKKKAEGLLNQRLSEIRDGEYADPGKLTVAVLFDRFLNSQTALGIKTLERYSGIATNQIIPTLGRIQLAQLSPLHLQEAYASWLKGGRVDKAGGLSPQSVLACHRLLHRVLEQAVKWNLVARNVADAVDPPRPERHEMRTLSGSDLHKLFAALDNPPKHVLNQRGLSCEPAFGMAVRFAAFTGCRRGEVLALRWEDVDLDGSTVSIRRSVLETKVGKTYFKSPKTGKGRVLELPESIVTALRRYKASQSAQRLAAFRYHDNGLVFARPDGSVIRPQTFSQAFRALIGRAGVPVVRLHDLRHTHATLLLKAGVHPKITSSRLGHSKVGVTFDLYAHVLPGMDKEAAERFDSLFKEAETKVEKPAC